MDPLLIRLQNNGISTYRLQSWFAYGHTGAFIAKAGGGMERGNGSHQSVSKQHGGEKKQQRRRRSMNFQERSSSSQVVITEPAEEEGKEEEDVPR